jgi:hypothetical protein
MISTRYQPITQSRIKCDNANMLARRARDLAVAIERPS